MDAHDWDRRYADSELVWSATPNQFVEAELADLSPGRAVDVATGEGRNAIWLADQGWEVTAVDFSQTGLDKGRALQSRHARGRDLHIDWVHADVLEPQTRVHPGGGLYLVQHAAIDEPADRGDAVAGDPRRLRHRHKCCCLAVHSRAYRPGISRGT